MGRIDIRNIDWYGDEEDYEDVASADEAEYIDRMKARSNRRKFDDGTGRGRKSKRKGKRWKKSYGPD